MKTQYQIVLEKLQKDGEISNVWAVQHYILRLGAIIFDLRNDGYLIEGKYKVSRSKKTRTFIYYLV